LLAGCGGNGSALPQSASVPGAASAATHRSGTAASERRSWMAPDAKNIGLLYVADLGTGNVNVYSYPGGRLKGVLTGFSAVHHECVDAAGNVFIANGGKNELDEYAHGGTSPIKIYHEPGFTHGCAVDPTTGNLAVLHDPPSSGFGGISLYKHAKGKATEYTTPNVFRVYFIGYDAKGDLFVDGTDMHVAFEFAQMPAASQTFEAVTLNQSINLPGAIQWDGTHLAVGDQVSIGGPSKINEFSINGTTGTLVGTTPMTNSCDVLQFWIHNKRVVAANDCLPAVMYFDYPGGGKSVQTISKSLSEPVGVTISLNP
ncbi:MAG: hypothetical protein WB615_14965, partial [Candidatus Tumulicola sp.]